MTSQFRNFTTSSHIISHTTLNQQLCYLPKNLLISQLFFFLLSELSSRPSGGDPWPLAMTSMGMRQYGGDSELVVEQPSTEDLSASPNCGSNINLLEAGSSSLHYSNPVSCNFQPATSGSAGSQFSHQQSANTHFQPHIPHQSMQDQFSAETRFNGTPQLSPGKIKKTIVILIQYYTDTQYF